MAGNRHGLTLIEGSTEYEFLIAPVGQHKRAIRTQPVPWESDEFGSAPWRVPLHPWNGGLHVDRLQYRNVYAKANADASNEGLLLPPPKLNTLTLPSSSATPFKAVEFGNDTFYLNGPQVHKVTNATPPVATLDKDLQTDYGDSGVDMIVYSGELFVCFGGLSASDDQLVKRTSAGAWSQSAAAIYSDAIGVVDDRFWIIDTTNQADNTTASPLLSTNYTTANYKVGDATYTATRVVDYGGVPWFAKADGLYQGDPESRFHNQIPSARRSPDADNGKNMFTAGGYLWCPMLDGLYRVQLGRAVPRGPEATFRPDYRFRVRDGFERNGALWLLVEDLSGVSQPFVCKMFRYGDLAPAGHEYVYHEIARLGSTSSAKCMILTNKPTNPRVLVSHGNDLKYFALGRGGGRDIDDTNYEYGSAWEIESGLFAPTDDMAVVSTFVGLTVVCNLDSTESLTCQVGVDETAYANLLNDQESGGGSAAITNTTDWTAATRIAANPTQGQMFQVKVTGSKSSGTAAGTDVAKIREMWAFGYMHPKQTDRFFVGLYLGDKLGHRQPITPDAAEQLFRRWKYDGTILKVELPEYQESYTIRGIVTGWSWEEETVDFGNNTRPEKTDVLVAEITRIDFQAAYNHA